MRMREIIRFCIAFVATLVVILQGSDLVQSTASALRTQTASVIMPIGMR